MPRGISFSLLCLVVFMAAAPARATNRLLAVLPLDVRMTSGKMTLAAQSSMEEMLRDVASNELAKYGWTVLTGETTLQVLADNGVDASRCGDQNCHLTMAREIKSEKFLSGAVQYVDGEFTASIRLIDTGTGKILSSERVSGRNTKALREAFEKRAADFFHRAGLTTTPAVPVPPAAGGVSVAAPTAPTLSALPTPPAALTTASTLGLEADADVLVAYDAAMKAEKKGTDAPDQAKRAWATLAALRQGNPYQKLAAERQKAWSDYIDGVAAAKKKRESDLEKLRKVLPLTSLPAEQRAQLVTNFVTAFGMDELPGLLAMAPADVMSALCAGPQATAIARTSSLWVYATDDHGKSVAAHVLVDGKKVGEAPFAVTLSACEKHQVGVSEAASGRWWEETVQGATSATARPVVFPTDASLKPRLGAALFPVMALLPGMDLQLGQTPATALQSRMSCARREWQSEGGLWCDGPGTTSYIVSNGVVEEAVFHSQEGLPAQWTRDFGLQWKAPHEEWLAAFRKAGYEVGEPTPDPFSDPDLQSKYDGYTVRVSHDEAMAIQISIQIWVEKGQQLAGHPIQYLSLKAYPLPAPGVTP